MQRYAILTCLAFAASTVLLAGCQSAKAVNDGSGYRFVPLKPATRDYVIGNDREAAEAIAGNNRQCKRDAQCRK